VIKERLLEESKDEKGIIGNGEGILSRGSEVHP
jgi:hypothetical protein